MDHRQPFSAYPAIIFCPNEEPIIDLDHDFLCAFRFLVVEGFTFWETSIQTPNKSTQRSGSSADRFPIAVRARPASWSGFKLPANLP
jgi:hypothetical protein